MKRKEYETAMKKAESADVALRYAELRIQTLETALGEAKQVLELAQRYFPKSIKNADRFRLLNVLANSVNPNTQGERQ